MKIETAREIAAAGDAKYGRAFRMLCDWQYDALEKLRDAGAISAEGYKRMVAVPNGRIVVDGAKGGPWIGVRTLTDDEVIQTDGVSKFVLREAPNAQLFMMADAFLPFLSPGVFRALTDFRAQLNRKLGWIGRFLCATPLGRYTHPSAVALLASLDALLDLSRGDP